MIRNACQHQNQSGARPVRIAPRSGGSKQMWYFAWILGLGLACAFAVLNALWHEVDREEQRETERL